MLFVAHKTRFRDLPVLKVHSMLINTQATG